MDNLHFIPNNILTNFFKELIKLSISFKLYIYIYIILLYYIMHLVDKAGPIGFLVDKISARINQPDWMHGQRDTTSFLFAAASNFELLSCYNLGEPIMMNTRLAFWGPIQIVTMNMKWQGNGWKRQRWSYWQSSSAKSWTCNYLSFFHCSVSFCGDRLMFISFGR